MTTFFAYNKVGNMVSAASNQTDTVAFVYDSLYCTTSVTNEDGTTTYTYDAAGNLVKEVSPDGSVFYTYNAHNRMLKGETDDGRSSSYTYNALGVRIQNEQVRENKNSGYQNAPLTNGSRFMKDYMSALTDFRATWQRVWETEVGTVVQNDRETVTKRYTVDYLSIANRDIMVTEDGSFVQRYVYDENGRRISAEFNDADGTARGTTNANGEYGENPASDIAVNDIGKVWYRTSLLNSTLFAVDANGAVGAHMIYDPWGNPLTETYIDTNRSGLDNLNNYTGYSWDETLELYYAQNRFYAPDNHRFTQDDLLKSGYNWYLYCMNNPCSYIDPDGCIPVFAVTAAIGAAIGGVFGGIVSGVKAYQTAKESGQNGMDLIKSVAKSAGKGVLTGAGAGALVGLGVGVASGIASAALGMSSSSVMSATAITKTATIGATISGAATAAVTKVNTGKIDVKRTVVSVISGALSGGVAGSAADAVQAGWSNAIISAGTSTVTSFIDRSDGAKISIPQIARDAIASGFAGFALGWASGAGVSASMGGRIDLSTNVAQPIAPIYSTVMQKASSSLIPQVATFLGQTAGEAVFDKFFCN